MNVDIESWLIFFMSVILYFAEHFLSLSRIRKFTENILLSVCCHHLQAKI